MTDASFAELSTIFSRLNPQDVEQFHASYQLWLLQQHVADVQAQIHNISQQISQNQEQLHRVQPSAISLAALASLQAHDVSDTDLLDRLLERGDEWLDRTMQRLAYCEKFEFIRGDYTDWCEHALEGAYDWIDSVTEPTTEDSNSSFPHAQPATSTPTDASMAPQTQDIEEILLQKLMSDEDEALMSAPTLKIAAITPTPPTETASQANNALPNQDQADVATIAQGESIHPEPEEVPSAPSTRPFSLEKIQDASEISSKTTDTSVTTVTTVTSDTMDSTNISTTHTATPITSTDTQDQTHEATPPDQEPSFVAKAEDTQDHSWQQHAFPALTASTLSHPALQDVKPFRKRNFWQRLFSAIFGGTRSS